MTLAIDIARTEHRALAAGDTETPVGATQTIELPPGAYLLQSDGPVRVRLGGTVSNADTPITPGYPMVVRVDGGRLSAAAADATASNFWVSPTLDRVPLVE